MRCFAIAYDSFSNYLIAIEYAIYAYPLSTYEIKRHFKIDLLFLCLYLIFFQEDLLIHGDSVYDIIDKQDHGSIQAELGRTVPQQPGSVSSHHSSSPVSNMEGEHRMFLCRMNVSRNARRQMRFGDQKVSFWLIVVHCIETLYLRKFHLVCSKLPIHSAGATVSFIGIIDE